MLKKLRQKINTNVIAIGIIILISIVLYGKYIATPFGDYDIWFERIVYGGYDFNELPQPLQKLEIPINLSEYIEYRERVVGRLFGSILPTYAMIKIFGDWILGWRIVLYLVTFATFWLLYSILKKLQISYWHKFFCLLFFIILLDRYFIKPISIIIGLSHLFFLIAMLLELNNSGWKDFRWRYSILSSFFVFLSLFIRELSATSAPALMAILLFWHNKKEIVSIKFKWNWRRLAPYAFFAALYIGLYLRMSSHKIDFAYSNMISSQIDFSYFKRVFLLLLKWIGLEVSSYLGLFMLIIFGLIFLLTLAKSRYIPGKMASFKLIFGILLLTPTLLLIPFLKHGTGSFTLQYLGVMIVCSFSISYIDDSEMGRIYKKVSHIFLCVVFASLWVIYALEARQRTEKFCVEASVTEKTVDWVVKHIPQNGILELKEFTLTSAYSFISDVFIVGRRDNIQYIMNIPINEKKKEKYYEYLEAPFKTNTQINPIPDIIIKKTIILEYFGDDEKLDEESVKVFVQPLKKYSIAYLLKNWYGRRIGHDKQYGPMVNFLAKIIFGTRPETFEKQLLKSVGYRIKFRCSNLEFYQ